MAGTRARGTAAAGTRGLAGGSSAFLDLIQSPDAVGRYVLEIALTPLNAAFTTPTPHTRGTRARGTRGLATSGGEAPVSEGRRILFSDGEYKTSPQDTTRPNVWCEVRITSRADVERAIRITQTASSRAQQTLGEIELNDVDGYIRDLLKDYSIKGQIAEVRYVPINGQWSDSVRILRAFVDGVSRTEGIARIKLRDISSIIDAPLILYKYGGQGLADGGPDLQGTYRPLALGPVRNVKPLLEDSGVWIYRFNNGPHQAIDEVTVAGLPLIKAGTFTGSYSELRGYSSLAEGEWIDAPGLGTFKANFAGGSPGGEVRCSGRGDVSFDGYVDTLGPCALRVIDYLSVDRTLVNVSSFSSLPSYKMQYWFGGGDTPPTGEEIFKAILDPVLGVYGSLFDERFSVGKLTPPEDLPHAQEFVEQEIIKVEEVILEQPPIYLQRMLYNRNNNPLTLEQIGVGLTEDEIEALTLRNPAPAEAFSGETKLRNRDAAEGVLFDTLLTEESDAIAACQLHIDYWSASRRAFEATVTRRGLAVEQATTWRGTHRELPGGIAHTDASVVGRRDDYGNDNVRLRLVV